MGVTKFVARDDASASKPAETRVNLGITTRYLSGLVQFLQDLQELGVTHTAGCPHYRVR